MIIGINDPQTFAAMSENGMISQNEIQNSWLERLQSNHEQSNNQYARDDLFNIFACFNWRHRQNESLVCENQEEGTETIFLLEIDFTADKRGSWNHKTPFSSLWRVLTYMYIREVFGELRCNELIGIQVHFAPEL